MKKFLLSVAMSLVVGGLAMAAADDGPAPPLSAMKAFSSGGTIHMELSAGDYSIRPAPVDQIHVTGTCSDPGPSRRLRADIDVKGSEATIVTDGPHNQTHYTIEVPQRSNLVVRLSAGNLDVAKVTGDLDISSHAGDVNIEVQRAQDYRSVKASVLAGDVNAPAFGGSKSGLFRSLRWQGSGTYRIRAHVDAGDLSLESTE